MTPRRNRSWRRARCGRHRPATCAAPLPAMRSTAAGCRRPIRQVDGEPYPTDPMAAGRCVLRRRFRAPRRRHSRFCDRPMVPTKHRRNRTSARECICWLVHGLVEDSTFAMIVRTMHHATDRRCLCVDASANYTWCRSVRPNLITIATCSARSSNGDFG